LLVSTRAALHRARRGAAGSQFLAVQSGKVAHCAGGDPAFRPQAGQVLARQVTQDPLDYRRVFDSS